MTVLARLLIAAVIAYIFIGLVYATALPPPWSSPMAFLVWFVLPAVLWPWNLVGFRGLPEVLVACVYLATVGLIYLAASRRSAPRRLKSTYPDHH